MKWEPIETAPKDGTIIEVETAGGAKVLASWHGGLVGEDGLDAAGWHATDGHPDCWDDGVCWASNANGEPSDKPIKWREAADHSENGRKNN